MEQYCYGICQSSNPKRINKRNFGDYHTVHDFADVYLHGCTEPGYSVVAFYARIAMLDKNDIS